MSALPQHACPPGWEQDPRIDDGHAHNWHMVITQPWGRNHPEHREAMTVCRACGAPRCGATFADDPCLERRHHRGVHRYESGRFQPIGGILIVESE
jgi:hypothetical protein